MSTVKSSSENLTLNADGVGSDVVIQNNGTETVRVDSSSNVLVNGNVYANAVVIDNSIADGGEVQFRSAGYNDWNQDNYNGDLRFFHTGIVYSTITSSGDFKFNSGYGSAATAYGVRAWVKFNGTGTVAINGSGNVSSITDNGIGVYTVNFSTSLPDSNYSVSGFACNNDDNNNEGHIVTQNLSDTYSTSALKIRITELTSGGTSSRGDITKISIMIVR